MSWSRSNEERISIPVKKIATQQPTLKEPKKTDSKSIQKAELLISQAQEQSDQILAEANASREEALRNLEIQLEQLKQEAIAQAAAIKQQAVEETEQIKQQAYDEAYNEGYHEGVEKGEAEGQKQFTEQARADLAKLKQTCLQIQRESEIYVDELIPKMMQLIKKSVEKVTMQVMEDSDTKLFPLIKSQLKELSLRKQLFIRIHPEAYEDIKQHEQKLQEYCVEAKIHFLPDPTLNEFGCVIESESEMIDLQLNKQLAQLFLEWERVVKDS